MTTYKIYQTPLLRNVSISTEHLIADTIPIDSSKTVPEENGGWVKEDRSQRDSYNVWGDDWSK